LASTVCVNTTGMAVSLGSVIALAAGAMAAQPSKARESAERKLVMVKNLLDPFTRGI
jgi:hypothetical protein